MARGTVIKLTNKLQQQLGAGIAADTKSHRIGFALFGQARTTGGVAQIAKFVEFLRGWLAPLMPGRAALAMPTAAKWQA